MDNLAARQQMVDQQIRTWEVLDPRVLDVFSMVPREAFVPPEYRELAFADTADTHRTGPIDARPKNSGQNSASPERRADRQRARGRQRHRLSRRLPEPAGSRDAIPGNSCGIDRLARSNLRAVPEARVDFETRDAFAAAPLGEFDAIAVTGSLPVYDSRFERSLRVGGRLFAIVGESPPRFERSLRVGGRCSPCRRGAGDGCHPGAQGR